MKKIFQGVFYFLSAIICCSLISCKKTSRPYPIDNDTPFAERRSLGLIKDSKLYEISGIVSSQRYPGYFWVHNDSGGSPTIYLLDSMANKIAQVSIAGVENRDWEDIAIGPGDPGGYFRLYIAETGDNRAVHETCYIYSFEEPGVDLENETQNLFIDDYDTYSFSYPDGRRDAETLMVDPLNNDFWIVSKREKNVHLYLMPSAGREPGQLFPEKVGTLPFHEIVGGEISLDGSEMLIKNYLSVFYWQRKPGESWRDVLQTEARVLQYLPEPQGEAIAFTYSVNGFVTISEAEDLTGEQHLYFYKRKSGESPKLVKMSTP